MKTILGGTAVAVAGAAALVLTTTTLIGWRIVLALIGLAIFVFGGFGGRK